ncbi:glycosyltransferase family 2 protein [Granulicoccus phenolivorans]|uniref:glycosyltransferase family 2 protein n=1 Tax=Granulicoccus phenolivorans TaxID=266854 RepID=UPI000415CF02|nr:glycosyltransferase family 2 protein [Granulicoccus phenolivorans]
MASVSVVIPHFGDPAPTQELVRQLLAQQDSPIVEIIVSDDHSPTPFPPAPGIRVIHRETNGGFGANVNSGAAAATGEYLLILNSDLEIGPRFVADLVEAAAPWQPCVAGSAMVDPAGHPAPTARHFPTTGHQVTEWLTPLARFRDRRPLHEAVGHDTRAVRGATLPVDWLVGAVLLIPTRVFRDVGGFDERFFMNSEEVDLQRRLRGVGIPSIYCGTVSVTHESGGSSDPGRRRTWLVDSRLTYANKWGGRRRLQLGLTAASVANLGWNTTRRLRGVDVAPVATLRSELDLIWGRR